MVDRFRIALVAAAAGFAAIGAAPAHAQFSASGQSTQASLGLTGGYDLSAMDKSQRIDETARLEALALHKTGVDALNAKNYAAAARAFGDLLHRDPQNGEANFLMGLAEIGLSDAQAAKGYLETATKIDVSRPEPKTRLGLTYIKLGDVAAAKRMRAELAGLDQACKAACRDAVWIADGIHVLDEALLEAETSKAPAPPATLALSVAAAFKPADYGAATFRTRDDVYAMLTADNRCPPGYKPEREEPCALIAYAPVQEGPGVYKQYYRPVFGVVSKNVIWTMADSRIASVSAKTLWSTVEVENTLTPTVKDTYRALAVVGNRENVERCNQAKPCLPHKELFLHFRDFKALPPSFIADFWGRKKITDPGEKRFTTDP